ETDFNKKNDSANVVAIQSDGKIVAAGSAANAQASKNFFALARYNVNGTLDTTFGGNKAKGKVTTDFGSTSSSISYLSVLPDGRSLAVGGRDGYVAFARYTSSGNLDTTFGSGGELTTTLADPYGFGTTLQSDGRIVIALRTDLGGGDTGFLVARFNVDGTPDTSFGTNGQGLNNFLP